MAPIEQAKSLLERFKESRLGQFLAKYSRDQADDHAALIAFSALFSIFPLIGGLLTLLGVVIADPATLDRLAEMISSQFPQQVSELVGFLRETRQISGLLGIVSFFGLLLSGSAIFGSMAKALNGFYGLPDRGVIGQKLMSFGMIFVFLILIVVSVVASSAATFLGFSADRSPIPIPQVGLLQSLLGWAISLGSAFLMFVAIYWVVPNARMTFDKVWRGALLAAVLFILINQIFPLYLRFFGGGFATYKTLGLFLLLMTWFYFLARIVVLGAELNAFLRPVKTKPVTQTQPERLSNKQSSEPASRAGLGRKAIRLAIGGSVALLLLQRLRRGS